MPGPDTRRRPADIVEPGADQSTVVGAGTPKDTTDPGHALTWEQLRMPCVLACSAPCVQCPDGER